jgi:hypothetical protein
MVEQLGTNALYCMGQGGVVAWQEVPHRQLLGRTKKNNGVKTGVCGKIQTCGLPKTNQEAVSFRQTSGDWNRNTCLLEEKGESVTSTYKQNVTFYWTNCSLRRNCARNLTSGYNHWYAYHVVVTVDRQATAACNQRKKATVAVKYKRPEYLNRDYW